ncbi:lipoprotein-releasing ABC transporter permease subunit [bacterium]|nr:lipoprotein-releasing ABC transporter permease subunit [bacterium]
MRYPFFIGLRYLRAKRSEGFLSLITAISTGGVAVGVMTLNVVLAVMTGFEEDLRDRILGFTPHVVVSDYGASMPVQAGVEQRLRAVPGVEAADAFVQGQAMLASGSDVAGVLVRGVHPQPGGAIDFSAHLTGGRIEDLGSRHAVQRDESGARVELPGIILGTQLARQLDVQVGEPVSVVAPAGVPTVVGMVPKVRRFAVVGLFEAGMLEYDSALAFIGIQEAQRFFGLGDAVSGIEIRTADLDAADAVKARIAGQLDFPYRVQSWRDLNHNLFAAIRLEKFVYFLVLTLIVLVAAFNIVATLVMVVMEKRRDIAVLKSMGATRRGIAEIFITKGLIIGGVGTAAGTALGLLLCAALREYVIPLPPGVFYTPTLPVKIYPQYFLLVVAVSLVICLLATLYPARQASRLVPVEAIRYD